MNPNPAAPPVANDRFLRALAGRSVDSTPVWIMRQAGRYLPAYRATRARAGGFLEMCKTPALAAEVTLQPIDAFGLDAAILFSDILIPLEAMGMEVRFDEGHGPVLPSPIRSVDDLSRLSLFDPAVRTGFVGDAIRTIQQQLAGRVPLIGFAGAPWTVASYAVEGGGSKSFRNALGWLHSDPNGFARLLDQIADATAAYLEMQADAGVHAIQLFESWGGQLSRETWRDLALPPIRRIVDRLKGRVPVILYMNGSPQHLEAMATAGADALGVDWRLPLDEVRRRVGPEPALQGNLDPCALYASRPRLEEKVRQVLEAGGGRSHVFNLGHGILPDAPVESVTTVVETVRDWRPAAA